MKLLVAYDDNNTTAWMMEQAVYRARKMDAFVYLVKTCPPDIILEAHCPVICVK